VPLHVVAAPTGDSLERGLEGGILERLDPSAVVADEVVVVLASGMRRLKSGDAVAEIDPLHEAGSSQALDGAVHAREAHPGACRPQSVVDLLRRQAAALAPEELDDLTTRPAAATARRAQSLESSL